MTEAKKFVFDADLARYIYSVSPEALAEMATGLAQVLDAKAMQTVIDIGVLDGDNKARQYPVPHRLVRAICPMMYLKGFDSNQKLFTDWLSQCARSQPEKVASIVYDLVAQDKIEASSLPALMSACGLTMESWLEDKDIWICGNNGQEYTMPQITLGAMLLLRQTSCVRTLVRECGWAASIKELPVLARSAHEIEGGAVVERPLNLIDIGFLGNGPNDPETAGETLSLALAMLDMRQWQIREAVTDALVRAQNTEILNAVGSAEPVNLVALAIDAGCNLEERDDLISGRGFELGEDMQRLPLLSCLASSNIKKPGEDVFPSNAQCLNAARRVIVEGGADPNEYSVHGVTALHYAIMHDNRPMVEMLLEHGADSKKKQQTNKLDALELAKERGFNDIAQMIQAWNAKQAIAQAVASALTVASAGAEP